MESSGRVPRPRTSVPRGSTTPPPVATPRLDRFPKTLAEWTAFAGLSPEARSAVYLRSIRSMLMFFTVVTVLGIVATVILVIVGINAANDATVTTNPNPFG